MCLILDGLSCGWQWLHPLPLESHWGGRCWREEDKPDEILAPNLWGEPAWPGRAVGRGFSRDLSSPLCITTLPPTLLRCVRLWTALDMCYLGFLGPASSHCPVSQPSTSLGLLHCIEGVGSPEFLHALHCPIGLCLHAAVVLPCVCLSCSLAYCVTLLDVSVALGRWILLSFWVEPLTLHHCLRSTRGFLWPHCIFVS